MTWFRPDYCLPEETVTKCEICGKLILEGPAMTTEEKHIRNVKQLPNYHNYPKHLCQHASNDKGFQSKITPFPKGETQEHQVDWIMNAATLYRIFRGLK